MCNSERVVAFRMTEKHIVTIGVEQSLSESAMYEHRCLENINKLYKYAVKCDYQEQYKAVIEATMVSTTEGFTENIPMSPRQPVTSIKTSARKSLHKLLDILEGRPKTYVLRFCATRVKNKATRSVSMLCSSIPKRIVY